MKNIAFLIVLLGTMAHPGAYAMESASTLCEQRVEAHLKPAIHRLKALLKDIEVETGIAEMDGEQASLEHIARWRDAYLQLKELARNALVERETVAELANCPRYLKFLDQQQHHVEQVEQYLSEL